MVSGIITDILTQKENDWGRYKIEGADGKEFLAVGVIESASIGMTISIEGYEEVNQYGRQFKVTNVLQADADSLAGVRRFFYDGYVKGIGKTKADALIRAFGKDAIYMFETEEGRKELTTVKGISEKTIERALPSYENAKPYREILLFLNGVGTKHQVEAIYNKYQDKTLKILKKNPYQLQLDIDGFGFKKVDALALSSGIKPDSIFRVMAAIKFILETEEKMHGHCFLEVTEIKTLASELLVPTPKFDDITEKVANNALANYPENKEKLIKAHDPSAETLIILSRTYESRKLMKEVIEEALIKAFKEEYLVNDNGRVYTSKMATVEDAVVKHVLDLKNSNPVRFVEPAVIESAIKRVEERKSKEGGFTFKVTDEQRKAVYMGCMNRISIISGGPGRGKTAIIEIVAEAFLSAGKYNKKDIIMLAPTGRAAQRITESTGYSAMTAHRAIASTKGGEDAPKNKTVVVDESSMVDIYLMKQILDYAKDCNLILVGDVYQIASVGPGKVLKDLIDSGVVPCILLEKGHRNTGSIAKNSAMINSGLSLEHYVYDEHFIYTPATTENILNVMVSDYVQKVKEYGITNVMLCAAMRERGPVAVKTLNKTLQEIFTKGKAEAKFGENGIFREGDRVMQTVNDYNFVKIVDGKQVSGVFNGERGTVVKVLPDADNESYKITVLFDDGSIGGYTKYSVNELTLAYATTLHKCQGSEASCMMMAYTFGDYMLLNRSLFYTGETRAKKEFRFYGEEKYQYGKMQSAFDWAVKKIDDQKRNTGLKDKLLGC